MSEVKDKLVTVESLKYVNDSLEEKIKDLSNLRVDITGDEGWYEFANIPCGAGECCGTTVCLEQSHGDYQYAAIVEMSVYNNPSVNDIQVLFRQISGMNITAKLIYVVDADAGVARFYVWKYASEHIYIYSLTGFELDNGITWIADSAAITSTIENHVFAYYEAGLSEKIKDSDTDSTYMTIHYAGDGLENADWVAAWNPDDPTQIKAIARRKLLKNTLANGADLNTVVESGFYKILDFPGNAPPDGVAFGNIIVAGSTDTIFQMACGWGAGAHPFWRVGTSDGTTMSPTTGWRRLIDDTDISGYVPKEVVLASGADLNTVVESGFYRLSANHVNVPDNLDVNYGNMIVSRGADTALQIVTPYSGAARLCYRSGTVAKNGAFVNVTNWRYILDNETYSPYSYPLAETNVCTSYCVDDYIGYTINMRTFNGVIYLDVKLDDYYAGATVGGRDFNDYATNPVSIPMSGVTQVQNYLNVAKCYITNSNAANLAWKGCSNAAGILIEATLTASSLEIKLSQSPSGYVPAVYVYDARTTITLVPTLI